MSPSAASQQATPRAAPEPVRRVPGQRRPGGPSTGLAGGAGRGA